MWLLRVSIVVTVLLYTYSFDNLNLTGRHRRILRAIAGRMKVEQKLPILPASNEISDSILTNIAETMENNELVALRFNKAAKKIEAKELGLRIAQASNSEVIQTLGHTVLLFRPTQPPSIVSQLLKAEFDKTDQ